MIQLPEILTLPSYIMCTGKRHEGGPAMGSHSLVRPVSALREVVLGLQVRAAPSCKQASPQPQSQHLDSFGLHLPQDIRELSQWSEVSRSTQSCICQAHHPAEDITKECLLEGLLYRHQDQQHHDIGQEQPGFWDLQEETKKGR